MTIDTIKGACHCGAITYSAVIDLHQPTIRCNCSICSKSRAWIAPIPASGFELLSGAEEVAEYRFGERVTTHCFCRRCGIKTHGRIHAGNDKDGMVAVCVATLEVTPAQLGAIQVAFIDGRNDRYDVQPEFVGYL